MQHSAGNGLDQGVDNREGCIHCAAQPVSIPEVPRFLCMLGHDQERDSLDPEQPAGHEHESWGYVAGHTTSGEACCMRRGFRPTIQLPLHPWLSDSDAALPASLQCGRILTVASLLVSAHFRPKGFRPKGFKHICFGPGLYYGSKTAAVWTAVHLVAHAGDVAHPARSHVTLALLPHSCSTPISAGRQQLRAAGVMRHPSSNSDDARA